MTTPTAEARVRRPHRAVVLTISLLIVALVGAGCTAGGDGDGGDGGDGGGGGGDRSGQALALDLRLGYVAGPLGPKHRRGVVNQVGSTVDRWFERAYLGGDYPRPPGAFRGVWPGWSRGLGHQVPPQRGLTSNASIGPQTESVVGRQKTVRVDVLAWGRRPGAATARFTLVFDQQAKRTWRHRVQGRLMLVPSGGKWQVVGYDINRSRRVLRGEGR